MSVVNSESGNVCPTCGARRHPDLFTPPEAADYLHLELESTLDWMREQGFLVGHKVGKGFMYHREHLDQCAAKLFGLTAPSPTPGVRTHRALRPGGQSA